MTPDILEDVHNAHARRYGVRPDKPEIRRDPHLQRIAREARHLVTGSPTLMAYLSAKFTVTRMETPPGGIDLATWQLHRASEAGVVAHLYDLALIEEESTDGR